MVGYYTKWIGFHLSGMYLGDDSIYGVQANLLFNISNTPKTIHSISILGGILHTGTLGGTAKPMDWKYGGISYNLNYNGFYLELGLSMGTGDASNPQILFQIGYLHRFNKI